MTTGRAIILNPTLPASVKRRQCLLDSLGKSGLEYSEEIEETRIVITWQGQPKGVRPVCRKPALPPPVTLEKCLKSRCSCEPDDAEYWDEMIALSAERESMTVRRIQSSHRSGSPNSGPKLWAVVSLNIWRSIGQTGIGRLRTFLQGLPPVPLPA